MLVLLLTAPAGSEAQRGPQWIDVQGAGGDRLRAAVFRPAGQAPAGKNPLPVVLVFHGPLGLDQPTLEWSRDLARGGFVTMAGCYMNAGLSLRVGDDRVDPCPRAQRIFTADLIENAKALLAAGRRLPGVRRDRTALIGQALGGNLALVLASSGAGVKAAISISGDPTRPLLLPNKPSGSALPAPIWRIEDLAAPVLIFHGAADPQVPSTSVAEYVRRARSLEKNVQASSYEGVGQGLWTSRHRPELVRRSVTFLRTHLRR